MADEKKPKSGWERFVERVAELLAAILAALFGAHDAKDTLKAEPAEVAVAQSQRPKIWPETHPGWERAKPDKLPKPTYAPATLALGITLAGAGIVTSYWVSVAGFVLLVLGLAAWIGQLK